MNDTDDEAYYTFWGHVEAFRKTLLTIAGIIGMGFIGAFLFYESLFHFVIPSPQPHQASFIKETIQQERLTNPTQALLIYHLPPGSRLKAKSETVHEPNDHKYELGPGAYVEYEVVIQEKAQLVLLSPLEGLSLAIKLSFWLGLALTSPFWIYVLAKFILPGLRWKEKQAVIPFIIASFLFGGAGLIFAHFATIPAANHYLETFNSHMGTNLWSLAHYVDYTLVIYFGHIVAAELCVLLLFGVHFGFITADWLSDKRRYMIVAAFVLAAILTPPDVLTQFLLAIPLMGVYEIAVLYAKSRRVF